MRKYLLGIGAALLLVLVACQSDDSKEVVEYHNGYINNVDSKLEEVDEYGEVIYGESSTDEEIEEAADNLDELVEEMVSYVEDQDPSKEDTKDYHALRLEFMHLFQESIDLELKAIRGLIDESLDEDEAEDLLDESYVVYEDALDKFEEAEEKLDELSEEYNLEEIKE